MFYIHMYVKPPAHFTHPHTRCPEKEKVEGRVSTEPTVKSEKEKGRRQSKHETNSQMLFAATYWRCTCAACYPQRSFAASLPRRVIAN